MKDSTTQIEFMNTQHTPGPWDFWDGRIFEVGENHITAIPIAEVSLNKKHSKQYDANCFLIASAPAMLQALIDIVESSTDQGAIECAISAIAEATGEKQ